MNSSNFDRIRSTTGSSETPSARTLEVTRGERRIQVVVDERDARTPPVLAIHGGPGFSHRYLRPWAGEGLQRTMVYLDLPGCGDSSRHPGSGYPLAEYIADVDAVRTSVGAQRTVLLGHAWGAILAVEYALAHPENVSALVLVNPLRILRGEGQDNEAQSRVIASVDPQVIEPFRTQLLPAIQRAFAGEPAAWREVDASDWWARILRTQFVLPPSPSVMAAITDIRWGLEAYFAYKGAVFMGADNPMAHYDLAERAEALAVPVLLIASDSDANYVTPYRLHALPILERCSSARMDLMSGVGHFPFIERTTEFCARVSLFLESAAVASRRGAAISLIT
jgi:proline iminopeptidase